MLLQFTTSNTITNGSHSRIGNQVTIVSMNKTKKIGVTVLPEIYEWLENKAKKQGRPVSNLAAFLLTSAVQAEMSKPEESV
jgi:hypothetical protein